MYSSNIVKNENHKNNTSNILCLWLEPGMGPRPRRLGLETVSRPTQGLVSVSSRRNCQRLGLVSVSWLKVSVSSRSRPFRSRAQDQILAFFPAKDELKQPLTCRLNRCFNRLALQLASCLSMQQRGQYNKLLLINVRRTPIPLKRPNCNDARSHASCSSWHSSVYAA